MMTTEMNLARTALLIIDMQNALLKDAASADGLTDFARSSGVIGNVARVMAAARQADMPVFYSVHVKRADGADMVRRHADTPYTRSALVEDTPGAAIVDELKPAPQDGVVCKRRASAFFGSDLDVLLRCRGIDTVIITGVVTNGCISASVDSARDRDYDVIVVSDGCAAAQQEDHDYYVKRRFPLVTRVRTADETVSAIAAAA